MRVAIEDLKYGEEKRVKINGKYIKTLARAVEGGEIVANAELLLMSDDSEKETDVYILYAENGTMCDYVFFDASKYIKATELIDIIQFNYVKDELTKTGIIIITKA